MFKKMMKAIADDAKKHQKEAAGISVEILAGGHIFVDKKYGIQKKGKLVEGDNPGEVVLKCLLGQKAFIFDGIEWEESGKRSGGKAAVGAIAGTLVAGPIGTTAGAAIGGRRKDTSKAVVYLIELNDPSITHKLHIYCNEEQYRKIAALS
jgi:hypothetical protein